MRNGVELLEGAVDMHVHAMPDFHPRMMNELEILQDAKAYGMRAIVSKSHYCLNADRVALLSSMVEGIDCFGGVVLNPPVGGINPSAVDAAIRYGGKEIWMPSFYTKAHMENFPAFKGVVRGPAEGIVLVKNGALLPEVHEILDLIAEANVILGTSHCSEDEIFILVREAIQHGVKKIIVTHPYCPVPDLSLEKQAALAEQGAYIELCLYSAMPISGRVTAAGFAQTISTVGAQRVVLATDFGQPFHPTPAEGMRIFVNNLLAVGIEKSDIEIMIKENPAELLDL
jgi:Family of unknown function (DUF6282)